jgi:phosphotransacetylase
MKQATGTGKYERLLARCETLAPVPTAVAYPCEATALSAAIEAANRELIMPLLVGPVEKIEEIAIANRLNLDKQQIINAPNANAAAAKAVELIRAGRAEILMKGSLHTDELMATPYKSGVNVDW